jgi:uncharacterized DUF497 family protein
MVDVTHITGFDWDSGNRDKNWLKHQVTNLECEELFFNKPLLIADDLQHSDQEQRYFALGQTDDGRMLFVAFIVREKKIRVISARDMSRRERRMYVEADS